ncbi:hypothetical protein UVI_02046440 [Ustilaginoidea virens]|uniref:U3 small nucleolar RNA-associated protein 10 n=1 Tax=Ustilaginoidea virens TaxID=1159556 RepID=A0A1B5L3D5_USTVR|nr:hypothetical protein UVI_02046440 [Ustilaginoidea virens]
MATSLAAQLAQIAAKSKATLDVKAQKAAHSKSLIWEPRVAATQSYQAIYATCHPGFEELCQLDDRLARFQSTLFSEDSQSQDRAQLSATENEELDRQVEAFLRLSGSKLRLMPAIKSIEWLIRRFRKLSHYPAQVIFWGGLMTEAVNGMLDRTRSGRAAVQSDNTQALLHQLGPIFAESLVMKKVPSLQIASYMAMTVFVSKGNLGDVAVTALMQQTVHGWTSDSIRPGLVCLAIMAQFRSAKQMNSKVTKALMKVQNIGTLLVDIGKERRVDKLANGLCLALIERFTKKGDSRGLPTIMAILDSQILKEKQTTVIFKSLLLTALKLDDKNDTDGTLRRELGSALIALSQTTGKSADIFMSVIQDMEFDIEELEMKLSLSLRASKLPSSAAAAIDDEQQQHVKEAQDPGVAIEELSSRKGSLPQCLVPEPTDLFEEFSHLFFSIVSESSRQTEMLSKFDDIPQLGRKTAFQKWTYFSFFIRIWCGPYPALARMAALNMARNRLKSEDRAKVDVQALIPYAVVALNDASKRVRQAAAQLLRAITEFYTPLITAKSVKPWASGSLYGKTKDKSPLASDITAKLLHLQIIPTVEECVMDPEHISSVIKSVIEQGQYKVVPPPTLEKKDHMGQSARLAVLSFFASHANLTPIIAVKQNLLKFLNEVKGVGSTTRTQVLLPLLNWWTSLSEEEALKCCGVEQLDATALDSQFVDVVVATDSDGIAALISLLQDGAQRQKTSLVRAIFGRLRRMWPSMKDAVKFTVAEQCLLLCHGPSGTADSTTVVPSEAADLLRTVPLTTSILSYFLDAVQSGTKMVTEPLPKKRRRTSSADGNRVLATQVTPELSEALRRFTFVLQLVENSEPIFHPELLDGLFTALSELQHFRTVVGSELGYLQNLILRSLLAMMPAYKANKELEIDSSGGFGDLLVNCIQKSSSPVVQNAALLLVADLATTAPNLVLHSVMPIFTFMGTSVLRQSDDYSAHVVSQTIKEVIPPLIESLRKGKNGPVAGAADILVSFATAYEHIPAHRRQELFVALVETLGPQDFLFALISMLIDRYDTSEGLLSFIVELFNRFDMKTQLQTIGKILDLVADLHKPKPSISYVLLGIGDDGDVKDIEKVALRQLSALSTLLENKKLRSQVSKLADREDMDAAEVRELYAALLENLLILADTVKANKMLFARCGSALSNLLNLLSISEFIKAVENLLDRSDFGLRQKLLRALEVRVETENNSDAASRNALLAFLPQLTAAIRDSSDIRYKHTAVTCVDKIAEKYGKKDVEAVVAAAETIAGPHCLGQQDRRLQVMALLCLTSLVDVLQDAVVPILPMAIPQAVHYLEASLGKDDMDQEIHSACYGFISSLAEHLPYMLSTYLDKILHISYRSAESEMDDEVSESRKNCLEFLAKKLDAKEVFTSLDRSWDKALESGFCAISEYLSVFAVAIEDNSKSTIARHSSVLYSILIQVLDLRRHVSFNSEEKETSLRQVTRIETTLNETAMKMIYKLNDAAFRPLFVQVIEWTDNGLPKNDKSGRKLRKYSVYGFLQAFFENLKSIVTNYATYIVEDAVKTLEATELKSVEDRELWSRVLEVLATCFEHDQDDFWQAPSHFGAVAPVLLDQFLKASSADVCERLVPAVVELAAVADSQAHHKDLNTRLMKHLKSEHAAVRLAAVKCEQALTDRLAEDWLSMLHEMLPRISELQEDDDEVVERETHRWIVKIEGVLGESLDAMLQ